MFLEKSNNGLNIDSLADDCLISIFEHLTIRDWLQLCWTSKRFRKIIVSNIVPRKLIDFTAVNKRHTEMLFQLFGGTMTKIKFSGKCINKRPTAFEKFLELLIKYSEPELLREVYLDFKMPKTVGYDLIIRSVPYFVNVSNFKIRAPPRAPRYTEHILEDWLKLIIPNGIHSIELNGINPYSDRFALDLKKLPKLKHLKLLYTQLTDQHVDKLIDFIRTKPQLKSFHMDRIWGQTDFESIGEYLSQVEHIGEMTITNVPSEIITKNLKRLDSLKSIALDGHLDGFLIFDEIFKILASKIFLERIEVYVDPGMVLTNMSFQEKLLELQAFVRSNVPNKPWFIKCLHLVSYDFGEELRIYLDYLLVKAFSFETCIVSFENSKISQNSIIKIIKNSQRLNDLIIEGRVNFSKWFYEHLIENRKRVISMLEHP